MEMDMSGLVENFVAACNGIDVDGVKAAVDAGVDVNAENSQGFTGLHRACGTNIVAPEKEAMVELLLKHPEIDLNKPSSGRCNRSSSRNCTPLHSACVRGRIATMRKLIQDPRMTSINTKSTYGTPIMVAVDQRKAEAVREMLKVEGVDLQTRNSWGRSLIQQARRVAHQDKIDQDESVILLQEAGAD